MLTVTLIMEPAEGDWAQAVAIGVVASLVLWVEEARKLIVRRRRRQIGQGSPEQPAGAGESTP
jgi:hypothetical protein